MPARFNIFFAWFFVIQTVAMGWVAAAGRMLLEALGVATFEGDVPGRIVGALLLFLLIYLIMHFRGTLLPEGNPAGNGFRLGHRILLLGNLLAAALFVFHFFAAGIESYNTHLILNKFTTAFGYWAMGLFAIGLSLIYQSGLSKKS